MGVLCLCGWALLYQNHNSNSSLKEAYHTSVIVFVDAATTAAAAVASIVVVQIVHAKSYVMHMDATKR